MDEHLYFLAKVAIQTVYREEQITPESAKITPETEVDLEETVEAIASK
jgi:hypothetical protein